MNNEWYTPKKFFISLNNEFNFTLDPCGCKESHMCDRYYSLSDDGLSKDWKGERLFINPPYDRSIYKWVEKAYNSKALSVLLLPARTDTKWFHEFCLKGEIRFIKGRISFSDYGRAPFPSMVVVFDNL